MIQYSSNLVQMKGFDSTGNLYAKLYLIKIFNFLPRPIFFLVKNHC